MATERLCNSKLREVNCVRSVRPSAQIAPVPRIARDSMSLPQPESSEHAGTARRTRLAARGPYVGLTVQNSEQKPFGHGFRYT